MSSTTMSVKALTTAANAVPMMNATASSTRLPRRRKFLKPVMVLPFRRG